MTDSNEEVWHDKNMRSFQTQSGSRGKSIREGCEVLILKVVQKHHRVRSRE